MELLDLDKKIFDAEADKIASYLIYLLHSLIEDNFIFTNELSVEEYAELWNLLADAVNYFIDEMTEFERGNWARVDEAYEIFKGWCKKSGITLTSKQTFSARMGHVYKKVLHRDGNERFYIFQNCKLMTYNAKENIVTKPPNIDNFNAGGDHEI